MNYAQNLSNLDDGLGNIVCFIGLKNLVYQNNLLKIKYQRAIINTTINDNVIFYCRVDFFKYYYFPSTKTDTPLTITLNYHV